MRPVTAGALAVVIFLAGALAGTAVSAQRRPTDPQCGSESVIERYRKGFDQESVLWETARVCAAA